MSKKGIFFILILSFILTAGGLLMRFLNTRWVTATEVASLRETTEYLNNPDRGFYLIHGIRLSDGMNPLRAVEDSLSRDTSHKLALLELSLSEYSKGDISETGLKNLEAVFNGLRHFNMRYIIRFVYDWDGHNMETEPLRRTIIERHMEQVAPVLNKNTDIIYTLQGLFVGNWGEMNGTRYVGTEHWRALAKTLAEETDPSIYLAVRTPMHWRRICGENESEGAAPEIRRRLGLFNDGILGSSTDLGTYGSKPREEAEYEDMWARDDELSFQEKLGRNVPNGGEVVAAQDETDLNSALEYLRTLHISYLNEDYDRRVLNNWASESINSGIWEGTDGLSYIREHLGYRFTASNASINYSYMSNRLSVSVDVKNIGFAPAYFRISPVLLFLRDGEECFSCPLSGDLSSLWGGDHSEAGTLSAEIPMSELEKGDYQIAIRLKSDRGDILMANDGRTTSGDTIIGGIRSK